MKDGLIILNASVDNMLTVYSTIYCQQPFTCQANFRILIPFTEYKLFILKASHERLIEKLFASSEADRYNNLVNSYYKHIQSDKMEIADKLFKFYYLNDIFRLGASEIRRAYERKLSPTWFIEDLDDNYKIDSDILLKYVIKEIHKLNNNAGLQTKLDEIEDILLLKSTPEIIHYRTYILYIVICMLNGGNVLKI